MMMMIKMMTMVIKVMMFLVRILRRLKANGTMGGGSSASKAWKEAARISNEKYEKLEKKTNI